MRWVIEAARDRSEKSMAFRLAARAAGGRRESRAPRYASARTRTAWPRPTRRSRTTAGSAAEGWQGHSSCVARYDAHRALSEHRHLRAHRRGQNHHDRAHPVLHRRVAQDRRGARRRGRHGLHGTGAGARHHHHRRRHHLLLEGHGQAAFPNTASTSSIRRDTSTSPSKWSAACACSTARSRCYDSVAGVQPQSETVWRQMNKYGVPRICVRQQDGPRRRELPALRRADPRRACAAIRCRSSCRSAPKRTSSAWSTSSR